MTSASFRTTCGWLVESASELLVPLAVDGERLLVIGHGDQATQNYYQVSLASPELVPLPPELVSEALASTRGTEGDALGRWQARRRGNYQFSVCPGYLLAHHVGELDTLFLLDAESEEERTFSRIGAHIFAPVCDGQHVYFYSYFYSDNGVELVGGQQLVRVDVHSGQLARLITPDRLRQLVATILGQDAENVYVNSGDAIFAVRKP